MSLLQLMKELKEGYGVEPVLLTPPINPNSSSSIVKEAEAAGIPCLSMRFFPFKFSRKGVGMALRYLYNMIGYRKILKEVRKHSPEMIHSNSSVMNIGGWLSRRLGVPHVWHLREFGDWDFNMQPVFGKKQEIRSYRKGDRFIAISKIVKERFLPVIPGEKIDVVYNGLALKTGHDKIRENREREWASETNKDTISFCVSGALNSAKRQIDAIEAMDILVNKRGIRNIKLYLAGEGGAREHLESETRARGLEDKVIFTGWVKDVESIYAKCDVGLMLSTNEAFGRVTIDYMRSGLAILASEGGANPELIEDGETGLLFPTGDVEKLADLMEKMVKDPELRHRLARNAYDFSMTHFLSKENSKGVYEVYKKVKRS